MYLSWTIDYIAGRVVVGVDIDVDVDFDFDFGCSATADFVYYS